MWRRDAMVWMAGACIATVVSPSRAAYATRSTFAVSSNVYGTSRQQRPLFDYAFPSTNQNVLIVGGLHAGQEANTVALVQQMFDAAQRDQSFTPTGLSLTFLVSANPDGLANESRMLASGVDPNRNWPTDDWTTDTYITGPVLVPGGGGPAPLSEPETQALATFVSQLRPTLIVSYHSAAGLVTGGPRARAMGFEAAYATAAGYPAGDWTAYPVTGDFAQWAELRQHVPTVEIELPDHVSTDVDANLTGLRATLRKLAGT
jgi:hypothetical protein